MTDKEIDTVYKMLTSYDTELCNLGTHIFLEKGKYDDYLIIRNRYIWTDTLLSGMGKRLEYLENQLNIRDAIKWRLYEKRSGKNTTDDK